MNEVMHINCVESRENVDLAWQVFLSEQRKLADCHLSYSQH